MIYPSDLKVLGYSNIEIFFQQIALSENENQFLCLSRGQQLDCIDYLTANYFDDLAERLNGLIR